MRSHLSSYKRIGIEMIFTKINLSSDKKSEEYFPRFFYLFFTC